MKDKKIDFSKMTIDVYDTIQSLRKKIDEGKKTIALTLIELNSLGDEGIKIKNNYQEMEIMFKKLDNDLKKMEI
jgi:transcriptional regulator